jgi:uncharacterized membrane protein YvlD (DUF360 family)
MAVRRSPKPLVGVRFPPPEPTLNIKGVYMKYLKVGLPFFVVVACIFNGIAAYGADNSMAVMAYITALFGWVAIAHDEYLVYRRNKRVEDATNSVA